MSPRERIRGFIVDSFFVDGFSDEESFLRSGIIDSLGMLDLIAFLENEFGITITDGELVRENLDSLAKVCVFVERKRLTLTTV
jgi:acyl carrier protein